jgi:hypothetical protein
VRNGPTGFLVGITTSDCLDDIEVILHVIERAIVRKTIQEGTHRVFGCHDNSRI